MATLKALDVLDTGPEAELDALVKAASLVCGVPVSLVSLVDSERQFFKANIGLPGVSETPRDIAFCAHAILDEGIFEVPDASLDERFHDNPLVTGAPDIRFYAGAPLTMSDGQRIGTLCVIDRAPKKLDAVQRQVLQSLALAAAQALEGRRAMRSLVEVSKELQETQDYVSMATRIAGVGIWNVDLKSGSLAWDAQMHQLYGVEPGQAASDYAMWAQRVHPADLPEAEYVLQQSMVNDTGYEHTFRIVRPDTSVRFIKALGRVRYDEQGTAVGMVGTNIDITDATLHAQQLQQMNAELEQSVQERTQALSDALQRARQAQETKANLLANMSHEFRTPLNAVLGMAYLASRKVSDPALVEMLKKISESGNRLLGLLTGILDLARIETNRLKIHTMPFSVHSVLHARIELMRPRALAKGLDIEAIIQPELAPNLVGDPVRIGNVLHNFLDNAIKFSSQGLVTVRVSAEEVRGQGLQLRIAVQDHGVGIDTQDQAHIFDLFEQVDATTTRQYGGVGIGLTICKQLVTMMGGSIGVESALGQGSTFWALIPIEGVPAPLSANGELNHELTLAMLKHLVSLLSDDDVAAVKLWEAERPRIEMALGEHAAAFARAMESFDFAAALQFLPQIRA